MLVNAYSTLLNPPTLDFDHIFNSRRGRTDPEFSEHLEGLIGFILDRGEREMTQSLYHVMRHIQRVQHHFSFEVDDEDLDDMAGWAEDANAILFLPDASVCDPFGNVLVDPETGEADEDAEVPYPQQARRRRHDTHRRLKQHGVSFFEQLPPVIAENELRLRTLDEIAQRALALFVVALRSESLASKQEIPVTELQARLPLAFEALSPVEREFMENEQPEQQEIINGAWGYESLFLLHWVLGIVDELSFPTQICNVSEVARVMLDQKLAEITAAVQLRSDGQILDALDLHFRLHWAVRQAVHTDSEIPAGLDPGVVVERHKTLNWLVHFEDADWDDVDTPT